MGTGVCEDQAQPGSWWREGQSGPSARPRDTDKAREGWLLTTQTAFEASIARLHGSRKEGNKISYGQVQMGMGESPKSEERTDVTSSTSLAPIVVYRVWARRIKDMIRGAST